MPKCWSSICLNNGSWPNLPRALIFHALRSTDAARFQNQLTNFLKNLSIFGGMLLLVERGFRQAR